MNHELSNLQDQTVGGKINPHFDRPQSAFEEVRRLASGAAAGELAVCRAQQEQKDDPLMPTNPVLAMRDALQREFRL